MRAIVLPQSLRVVVLGVLSLVLLSAPVAAHGANKKIDEARAEARQAREKLDSLAADLEERSEEYLVIEEELADTRSRIRVSEGELELAELEVAASEQQLSARASSIYRRGTIDIWSVFVGVTDFGDFVTRLELFDRVGRSDASLVARVKAARESAARTRASLESRRTEQVVLLKRASSKRQQVEEALAAQKSYLASVDKRLADLIAEERRRQEEIAREKAEAAARAAARSASRRSSEVTDLPAPHPEVSAYARQFLGKTPYVWGGTTPSGFDCSGLTQYCYRAIGISIPRTSRQQYRFGAFIPPDRLDLLAEGDLVFFGRDADPDRVHHVGIYSGEGRFIHAPQTGMRVSESSLLGRIAERGDYVGAVRP